MNQAAKSHLALVISIAYGTGTVNVGDSAQRQAESDTDIVGNLIGTAPANFTVQGDIISTNVSVPFIADGTAQEVAFLDALGNLIERYILPSTTVRVGGSLKLIWSMEVL
jgi:hypothetical protein